MVFQPDDPFRLWQQPPQREPFPHNERSKGYRYPAPGSHEPAVVPNRESVDDLYDIKRYASDPRNLPNLV
jgi:hypothetical protein